MAVNQAVYGMLRYEKALGNAISNTLCKRGIQHGRGVYSSIIPLIKEKRIRVQVC